MRRVLLIAVVILAGCDSRNSVTPEPALAANAPPVIEAAPWPREIADAIPGSSASWPTVTPDPIRVEVAIANACANPFTAEDRSGPHYVPYIVVRTNPEALEAFRKLEAPMPVGTVIIKEKHSSESAAGPPDSFGAMIKREPGYDPDNGDWEYVFGGIGGKPPTERGRLANCIACHSAYAKDEDYLFRDYDWMWESNEETQSAQLGK